TEALDELIQLLNDNPNVTIELGAHCDYRGNDAYNLKLSQRRAESVVRYLVAGGIAADRLTAKGYGEEQPKVATKYTLRTAPFLKEEDELTEEFIKNLPPEEQEICNAINRRTEFKVLRTTYGLR
ncbi:OmpA family protein, partial [Bacteroides sp. OttesenSCG-928-J23]|nr:OmpA family protein [Bacteroides sp. OttesenSCG-928-J23]